MKEHITLTIPTATAFLGVMVASIVIFSPAALADCTCNHYGHCAASSPDDWEPTSFDYGTNQIIFYIDRTLDWRERQLIHIAIGRWLPAMRNNGIGYMIRPTSDREINHGIHELTIGFIRDNDGSILGVTHDGGVHHRHVVIERRFWLNTDSDLERIAVVTHEIGHVLGLGHSSDHGDLMHDHYNPDNMYPTRRDLVRATLLLRESVRQKWLHQDAGGSWRARRTR